MTAKRRRLPPALLCLLACGCRGEPAPYLHALHVEALDLSAHPDVRARVRLVREDGRPAPAPESRSVSAVVQGKPLPDWPEWSPVAGSGVRLVLLAGLDLGEQVVAAQRDLFAAALGSLTGRDRAVIFPLGAGPEQPLRFVEPASLAPSVAGLRASGEAAAPPKAGPPARAPAPVAAIARALAALEAEPPGRRVVVVPVMGPPDGRRWKALGASAAAAGADLHVLGFAPRGRRSPRSRVAEPLYVFPVDLEGDTKATAAALAEAIGGGMWAQVRSDRPPVEVAQGFALRARLPRGGWEDFALAHLEAAPGRVALDAVKPAGPGACMALVRVADSALRSRTAGPGEVALGFGAERRLATRVVPALSPVSVIVVYDRLPGADGGLPLLRRAAQAALAALGAGDRAAAVPSGRSYADVPALLPRSGALEAVDLLTWPDERAPRDLLADLEELLRRLAAAAPTERRALLVLSGPGALRSLESAGSTSPRLRQLLADLRAAAVTLLWAAAAPEGRAERAASEVARAGGLLALAGGTEGLPAVAAGLVAGFREATAATFPCPEGAEAVASSLRAIVTVEGRLVESPAGATSLRTPVPTTARAPLR